MTTKDYVSENFKLFPRNLFITNEVFSATKHCHCLYTSFVRHFQWNSAHTLIQDTLVLKRLNKSQQAHGWLMQFCFLLIEDQCSVLPTVFLNYTKIKNKISSKRKVYRKAYYFTTRCELFTHRKMHHEIVFSVSENHKQWCCFKS